MKKTRFYIIYKYLYLHSIYLSASYPSLPSPLFCGAQWGRAEGVRLQVSPFHLDSIH